MPVSGQALRLASLVAAAAATGYLWRAALEPRDREQLFAIAPPALRFQLPESAFHPLDLLRPVGGGIPDRAVAKTPRRRHARPRQADSATLIARVSPAPARTQPSSARSRAKPPAAHQSARPVRKPRIKPRPKPPPPPPAAPPPVQPAPPPPTQQPAPPPPPPVRTRPGWGRGDKNHVHTGPPGQQRGNQNKRSGPPGQEKEKKAKKK